MSDAPFCMVLTVAVSLGWVAFLVQMGIGFRLYQMVNDTAKRSVKWSEHLQAATASLVRLGAKRWSKEAGPPLERTSAQLESLDRTLKADDKAISGIQPKIARLTSAIETIIHVAERGLKKAD